MGWLRVYKQINTFTGMKPQNFVADVIYLDFADLIRVYDASYSQKMATSVTAFLRSSKPNNYLIFSADFYTNFHQNTSFNPCFAE